MIHEATRYTVLKLQATPGRYDADEVQIRGFLLEKMSQKKETWMD